MIPPENDDAIGNRYRLVDVVRYKYDGTFLVD
jgi:hypothetical protein